MNFLSYLKIGLLSGLVFNTFSNQALAQSKRELGESVAKLIKEINLNKSLSDSKKKKEQIDNDKKTGSN